MKEVWKDIVGYEGLYQVSNLGRIKSFRKWNRAKDPGERILNPTIANNGYEQVTLYRGQKDRHKFLVHRIVANAFIENPENLEAINHKDENRLNNRADNLEWCTLSYNNAYGTARIRGSITQGRPIDQYTLEGIHLATYESLAVASMITGISSHAISDCCKGRTASGKGYVWRYKSFDQ